MNVQIQLVKKITIDQIDQLTALINVVYKTAEAGIWKEGELRIDSDSLATLIAKENLFAVKIDGKIVGCVNAFKCTDKISEFGLLAVDDKYRLLGIGRKLIEHTEQWSLENGYRIHQLHLLVPQQWAHPSKEFLKNWYGKMGYKKTEVIPFESYLKNKIKNLATPCEFIVFQKQLKD